MLSIGTTHVNAWRGFNFGKNDGSQVEHQLEDDDDHPAFIASARHFIAGRAADFSRPTIAMEDE